MVTDFPNVKEPEVKCTNCMKGKQQREVIPKKSSWSSSIKLELIHSYICGPINPEYQMDIRKGISSLSLMT
jgi:hypothetical protein